MLMEEKEEVYGSFNFDGSLFINVPLIYKDSLNEENFIDNFSLVVQHEVLHKVIAEVLDELVEEKGDFLYNPDFEEKIVRSIIPSCKIKKK